MTKSSTSASTTVISTIFENQERTEFGAHSAHQRRTTYRNRRRREVDRLGEQGGGGDHRGGHLERVTVTQYLPDLKFPVSRLAAYLAEHRERRGRGGRGR